jgi:Flp pilus assembly protein TadB
VNNQHEVIKHMGDFGATVAAALVAVSHWAQILSPIITVLVGLSTLAWWVLRWREYRKTGKVNQ